MRLKAPLRRQRRRPSDEDQRVLPLINVVFLLLIFFMIAGQLAKTDPVVIHPPTSSNGDKNGEQHLHVYITAAGRLVVGTEDIAQADLVQRFRRLLQSAQDRVVYVKADAAVEAQTVIRVMDRLKAAGAERVRLMTVRGEGSGERKGEGT